MGITCFLHIGMHKTGSSSIQATLSKATQNSSAYYLLKGRATANLSGTIATVFGGNPSKHKGHKSTGRTTTEVRTLKKHLRKHLHESLDSNKKENIIVSAEYLSKTDLETVRNLKSFLSNYCDEFKIIGYVRSPISYMESAIQQRIKGGTNHFRIKEVYPCYRDRFEKFDEVFGEENVFLTKFSKETLYKSDVVKDFARHLRLEIPEKDILNTNESISLEALSLLFAQRKLGSGLKKHKGTFRENRDFIHFLSQVGNQKLQLAHELTKPIIDSRFEDIEWMERRLACSLVEPMRTENTISSEDELLEVAMRSFPELMTLSETQQSTPNLEIYSDINRLANILNNIDIDHVKNKGNIFFDQSQWKRISSNKSNSRILLKELSESMNRASEPEVASAILKIIRAIRVKS